MRLRLVAERVEENGELITTEPGECVSRTQTRFETARDRREQLVADQVSETVVDHLESIEVEIEHGESTPREPFLELGEPPSQPLDEDRAVAKARERIEEPGIAQPLLRDRLLRRVGQRAGDANGAAARAAHGHTAAQEPPVCAVLVTDAVLVLKVIGGAGEGRRE